MEESFASMARSHERAMEQISTALAALVRVLETRTGAAAVRGDPNIESSTRNSESDDFMSGSPRLP